MSRHYKFKINKLVISILAFVLVIPALEYLNILNNPSAPVASVESGYYEDEFTLYFDAGSGGDIYYTLDGSIPGLDSTRYDGSKGIQIVDISSQPNVYNSIKNVVEDYDEYEPESNPVPKGIVVRAVYINVLNKASEIVNLVYYAGIAKPEGRYTLNIVFEPDDLFGDDGIYITGKEYDDWYMHHRDEGEAPKSNFIRKIEKKCCVQLIDYKTDDMLLNQKATIRIQGSSKRYSDKKRFIIEADTNVKTRNFFDYKLFHVNTHSVMLKKQLTDALVGDCIELLNESSHKSTLGYQKNIPVRVYLNGEFWYDSFLLERYDDRYFKEYYNINKALVVKNAEIDGMKEERQDMYLELQDLLCDLDMQDDGNLQMLERYVDVDSYIDYTLFNFLFCNVDYTEEKNYVMWKSLDRLDDNYKDGRWRFLIYDIDALETIVRNKDVKEKASVNAFVEQGPYVDMPVTEQSMFKALIRNQSFVERMSNRLDEILDTCMSDDALDVIFSRYSQDDVWMRDYLVEKRKLARSQYEDMLESVGY